jgi:hypothetical protein
MRESPKYAARSGTARRLDREPTADSPSVLRLLVALLRFLAAFLFALLFVLVVLLLILVLLCLFLVFVFLGLVAVGGLLLPVLVGFAGVLVVSLRAVVVVVSFVLV